MQQNDKETQSFLVSTNIFVIIYYSVEQHIYFYYCDKQHIYFYETNSDYLFKYCSNKISSKLIKYKRTIGKIIITRFLSNIFSKPNQLSICFKCLALCPTIHFFISLNSHITSLIIIILKNSNSFLTI